MGYGPTDGRTYRDAWTHLKTKPSFIPGLVEATVIETRQVEGRGKLATILVERGTLKNGAFLVAGAEAAECKVRGMNNAEGKIIKEVKPAEPVEVMGWKDLPNPGDKVLQVSGALIFASDGKVYPNLRMKIPWIRGILYDGVVWT